MVLAACATRCPPRKARGRRFGGQPEPVHKTAMLPVACRMPEYQALGTKGGAGAATLRTAPRPSALRKRMVGTRMVSPRSWHLSVIARP